MAKSIFGRVPDNSILSTWGSLIFLSSMANAAIYTVVGLYACRKLIRKDARWLFILPVYFVVGFLQAFFTLAVICVAIACVLYNFNRQPLDNGEMIAYSGVLVIATLFFAVGRKSILYAL